MKLLGINRRAGSIKRIVEHIRVAVVQLPKHLTNLVVPYVGVGSVHDDDELCWLGCFTFSSSKDYVTFT